MTTPDRWQQIARLYEAARACQVADRTAFLADACAADEDLRREVESLLAQPVSAAGVLDGNALAVVAQLMSGPDVSSAATGRCIGSYEIQALLGVGGMGEVYRARDTKLNRDVALKLLPARFADDRERVARFQREAQVLALLNHPHIGAIYGLEEANGVRALVLELVEGPTLDERLRPQGAGLVDARVSGLTAHGSSHTRGLPLDEALRIGRQIAEALGAAHEQGIIHRDLKPANIKLRGDGVAKVLDFGLAKLTDVAAGSETGPARASQSLAVKTPAMRTGVGAIMGTAPYMAPEQATGREADKRSDIWAFGCVLYEMLTGRRAFEGEDSRVMLAAVLGSEPDWTALPPDLPAPLLMLLHRCLEKDARRRVADIAVAQFALDESVHRIPEPSGGATRISAPRGRRHAYIGLAAGLVLTAIVASAIVLSARRPNPVAVVPVTRFQLLPPEKSSFTGSLTGALAPDGTRLVFSATDASGRSALWLRQLDAFDARPLAGTEGATYPFWSPDGRAIAFFVTGKIRKIDAAGGVPSTICDTPAVGRGGTWNSQGTILFGATYQPIFRVAAEGGQPVAVTKLDEAHEEASHLSPSFLPDGRHFLYWVSARSPEARGVWVGSIESGSVRRLLASDGAAMFVPPGVLLFRRGAVLWRQGFDQSRLAVQGEATPVIDRIAIEPGAKASHAFTASASNGVLAFRSSHGEMSQFTWFDRGGRVLETVGVPGNYRDHTISPDDKQLAFVRTDDQGDDIWIQDLSRHVLSRFTSDPGMETRPIWSPDGATILYFSNPDGSSGTIVKKAASGTGAEQLVVNGGSITGAVPAQVSPDGKLLLYFGSTGLSPYNILAWPLTGAPTSWREQSEFARGQKPIPILATAFNNKDPQISPDGHWMAYISDETKRFEVYVQPFPPSGRKWQISSGGGGQPTWRADGKELFFVSGQKLQAVDVRLGESFAIGTPHVLFEMREMRTNVTTGLKSYVPSRDGQRFLINSLLDATASPINVVLNWTEELKRPAPGLPNPCSPSTNC